MGRVFVAGSINMDVVATAERHPRVGETVAGTQVLYFPGGKGANQAVAAARLGGQVSFLCKLGDDLFGRQSLAGFQQENIDTSYAILEPGIASGVALITVNRHGENNIVVASGANGVLSPREIDRAHPAFEAAGIVLLQLETPLPTVEHAIQKAADMGKKVILNPAPAQALSAETYRRLFLITPNETEAALLAGIEVNDLDSAGLAAGALLEKGVRNVIITLGAQGALFRNVETSLLISPPVVTPVDTTAAGDVFNGALTVALAEGQGWESAIDFACRAAAVSVTRMGAQASAPHRHELGS